MRSNTGSPVNISGTSQLLSFLTRLKQEGIKIRVVRGELKINAPRGKLTPGLVTELKGRKGAIIEFLQKSEGKPGKYSSIEPVEKKEYYRMSSPQQRLYILQQMNLESTAYNVPQVIELQGEVAVSRLESIFTVLIARHESLRTWFRMKGKVPWQMIRDSGEIGFNVEYYQGDNSVIEDFVRPFALSEAPLLRVGLVTLEPLKHLLIVDMHHIISDGISHGILRDDFLSILSGWPLLSLRLQYKDYSQWQQGEAVRALLKKQEEYWLQEFQGEIPVLELPMDYPRPLVQSNEGSVGHFDISPGQSRGLYRVAQEQGVTLFMLLLAVYQVLLFKLSGQEDIVVGTAAAGRRHADLERIIGMFVNTLAVRSNPHAGDTFSGFLSQLKQKTIKAFDNQEYPFEELVEKIAVERDLGRNPLYDVMFEIGAKSASGKNETGNQEQPGLKANTYNYERRTAKFDLILYAYTGEEKLAFSFEYCTRLFNPETIDRFIQYFKNILSRILTDHDVELAELGIISTEERNRLLNEFNDTAAGYPREKTLHELFREQVQRTPDHTALQGRSLITYRELEEKSGQLARLLKAEGVHPDDIVGILSERSITVIIAMLGILEAGGAYLPIDPDYPEERIAYMIADSSARVLVTSASLEKKAKDMKMNTKLISLDCLEASSSQLPAFPSSHSSNLAYIIYTSGTTGKPKGVMIEHGNVVRLMINDRFRFDFNERDIWTMFHSFCFDFSVWEMYGALLYGGQLAIIPKTAAMDIPRYLEILKEKQVTILNQTPSAFYHLVKLELKQAKKELNLRYIIFGGEALAPAQLKEWKDRYPETKLINMYGITETTVHVTFKEISRQEIQLQASNIGTPIPTLSTYIMDRHMQVVPMGAAGELTVGGDGVGRGYLNRPGLSREKFVSNPYKPRERLYKSGDLAKLSMSGSGEMEYLGRIDQQIKIRGFRIELGEIETQLLNHRDITDAVVIQKEWEQGDKYLCAYVVATKELLVSGLREYLGMKLPDYMVPSYFMQIERMPLTSSGKLDRKSLPSPQAASDAAYAAPRNSNEEKLVRLWADILGIEKTRIGIDDNFFELGGHSLRATILTAQIHKEFNVKFPLLELFRTPTIREIWGYIKENALEYRYLSIEAVEKREYYVLSSAQKRLYIIQEMDPESILYNVSQVIPLQVGSAGNIQGIEKTFLHLIRHHESLRTSFHNLEGELFQEIHEPGNFEFSIKRLPMGEKESGESGSGAGTGIIGGDVDESAVKQIIKDFIRYFDLSQAPLLRVGLVKISAQQSLLLVDMHHIICDGVSYDILIKHFFASYAGRELPCLRLQYKDFSQWQSSDQQTSTVNPSEAFWLKQFQGNAPEMKLPMDYERPPGKDTRGDSVFLQPETQLVAHLKDYVQEAGTTLYILLATVFTILLSKYTGQEDIVVGSTVTGRPHADLHHIIGMFVNVLPIRTMVRNDQTFNQCLTGMKTHILDTLDNQDYQFDDLVARLKLERESWRNPLFDMVLDFRVIETPAGASQQEEETPKENRAPAPATQWYNPEKSIFDLVLAIIEIGNALVFRFTYLTCLFKRQTIEAMARHFIRILEQVIDAPDMQIADIEVLSSEEKDSILENVKNQKSLADITNNSKDENPEVTFNF